MRCSRVEVTQWLAVLSTRAVEPLEATVLSVDNTAHVSMVVTLTFSPSQSKTSRRIFLTN